MSRFFCFKGAKMTELKEVLVLVEDIAPLDFAESWDNSGLQIGDKNKKIGKITIALDPDLDTIDYCIKNKTDLLITHHPLFFSNLKSINYQDPKGLIIYKAISNDLCIYSAHTSLDSANGGLNDYFLEKIGFVPDTAISPLDKDDQLAGLGRISKNHDNLSGIEIANKIKKNLNIKNLRIVGDTDLVSPNIGVCTGSGASLMDKAFYMGAKVYITGDLKYHEAQNALEKGMCVIDAGHHGSEIIACELFKKRLDTMFEVNGISIKTDVYLSSDVFTVI